MKKTTENSSTQNHTFIDTDLYEKHYPDGVKWEDLVEVSPVYDLLAQTARKFGSITGFTFLGKTVSWENLYTSSLKLAGALQETGIKKGSKVGLCMPNCPAFLIAYYGVLRTGATVVNFNPLYAPEEIQTQIEDSQCETIITLDLKVTFYKLKPHLDAGRLKRIVVCRFTDMLPFPKNFLFSIFKAAEKAAIPDQDNILHYKDLIARDVKPAPVDINPHEDVALLQYTGGTTGLPKGAMLTHANVTANAAQAALWFAEHYPGKDKMVGIIPFFHVFAMTAVMNLSVRCGFEIIATPRFNLTDTLKLIHKHKPHFLVAVPAIYTAINTCKDIKKYDLSSLRYCISGGAPLPVEVKRKFEEKTGCYLVEGYGLTESSPVVTINPPGKKNPPGSIGLPVPGTLVKIIDKDDGRTEKKPGEPGELWAKGPQVMKGYWQREQETRDTLVNGWLRTGDVAKMDEDGFIYIVDRIKDLIISNGYNIYPRHVEEAIYKHNAVEECIVAGIPDERRGEIVKAWIKLKDGRQLDKNELLSFLEEKISRLERPRAIEFRSDPLPKTLIGKLSRKDIVKEEMAQRENKG